jgi:hypothetical protein
MVQGQEPEGIGWLALIVRMNSYEVHYGIEIFGQRLQKKARFQNPLCDECQWLGLTPSTWHTLYENLTPRTYLTTMSKLELNPEQRAVEYQSL